jgi:predicted RNase H-like HicB family nuclease
LWAFRKSSFEWRESRFGSERLKALLERYTVVIRPDDNGTFVAYVPAIPGCHAVGDSPTEAQEELQDVFEMICEEYREAGKELPGDVQVTVRRAG